MRPETSLWFGTFLCAGAVAVLELIQEISIWLIEKSVSGRRVRFAVAFARCHSHKQLK
jgi:hypothetical protein